MKKTPQKKKQPRHQHQTITTVTHRPVVFCVAVVDRVVVLVAGARYERRFVGVVDVARALPRLVVVLNTHEEEIE